MFTIFCIAGEMLITVEAARDVIIYWSVQNQVQKSEFQLGKVLLIQCSENFNGAFSLTPSHPSSAVTLKSVYECPLFLKIVGQEEKYLHSIQSLEKRTEYRMSQKCGQRIYSDPPNWNGPPPPRGSEVYLSIHRDKYEYDVDFGQIYDMRLMVDFSGTNRGGFAYVRYANPEIARSAVNGLSGPKNKKNVIKKASMSDDNCVLFVMGIPVHLTKDELFEHFSRRTERLQSVTTRPSSNFNSPNRGFCFLEYANHSYAAQARRELLLDPYVQEWRSEITVNWSIPDKQKNDPAYEPSKNIFVNNLPEDINFQRLMSFLAQHMDVSHYVNCKVIGTKAFIGFTSRDEAEFALHIIEGMKIGDRVLHASWARPMQKNRDRDRLLKQDYASCNARLRFPSISEESENHSPSHSPCSGYTAGSVQEFSFLWWSEKGNTYN
uniref:APOBEC1 complementation factor n=1 Tax=Cacopsylla melanoneura TaxID=428564 RepID=A0A8D8XC63_9HEMI